MKNNNKNVLIIIIMLIIGFFSGIAFINNWLAIHKKYPKIALFEFPFDVNIWGTVSDWFIVITTIITGYFLVKTFQAQKIATDIAHLTYIKSNMPFLILESGNLDPENNTLVMRVKNNTMYNIDIETQYVFRVGNQISNKLTQTETIILVFNSKPAVFAIANKITHAKISYKDVNGNTYRQELHEDYNNKCYYLSDPEFFI